MSRKLGELVVVAISAKNLVSPDVVGKADPYATFRVAEVKKRTKTDKRGGQHPEWDEEVRFDITDEPKSKKLEVEVYNEDVREPDFIGSAKIDLVKVLSKGEEDGWFEIKSRGNKFAGEILLEMTFYNTNVLPLQVKKPNSTPSKNPNPLPQHSQPIKPATLPFTNNQFATPPIVNNVNNPIASPPMQSTLIYPPPVSQSTPLYPPPPTQYPPQNSSFVPGYPSYSSPPPSNANTSPIVSSAQVGGLGFPVPVPTPNVSTNLSNMSMAGYPPVNSAIIPPVNSAMNPYQTFPPNNNNNIYPPPNNNNIYPPPNNNIYPPQQGYYNQGNSYPSSGQH